jgi:DNA polymerase (family 10)
MQLTTIRIDKPDATNFILGQTHFIKSVEDIHEALVGAVPGIKFGLAFCEASGKCLVRCSPDIRPKLRRISLYQLSFAELLGAVRRRETVGDLDMLVAAGDGEAVGKKLVAYENVAEVLAQGPTRTTVVLRSGIQVDLRVVLEESYGAALLYFTGSKAHNIALRGIANERGWKLNEYGLFAGSRRVAGATEQEVYKKLGLAFVPPELREDRGEVAAAKEKRLPNLVALDDIRGDLHVHTSWTDGTASIAEMAAAAKRRGYEYIAITDHSRRVTMALTARGSQNRSRRWIASRRSSTRLDVVVAAVHYNFDLGRDAQTGRIIRAMDNRHVSIIAHPTGRLI